MTDIIVYSVLRIGLVRQEIFFHIRPLNAKGFATKKGRPSL